MSQEATSAVLTPARCSPPLRQRILTYFAVWFVAALIIASRRELDLLEAPHSTDLVRRLWIFVFAPFWAAVGLDFAVLSAMHQHYNQVGLFMWLFLAAFISHLCATFSCVRHASFFALIAILIITLSISVFYALQFFHIDATTGHG